MPSTDPTTSAASPYVGSHNIVGGGVVGIAGLALIALIFVGPGLALVVTGSAFLGGLVGLHVQAIREAEWQERQRLRRLGHAR